MDFVEMKNSDAVGGCFVSLSDSNDLATDIRIGLKKKNTKVN